MHDNNEERAMAAEPPRGVIVWLDEAVLIFLLLLSVAGAVITDFSPQDAYLYWLVMIPVFGLGAMIAGWAQVKREGRVRGYSFGELFKIQLLHWSGGLCTVIGVFVLRHMRFLDETAAALVILLILGLATFLDGIRIGWRFSLIGVYLGISAILVAYLEQFLAPVVLLAILLIVYTIHRGRREARRRLRHEPS